MNLLNQSTNTLESMYDNSNINNTTNNNSFSSSRLSTNAQSLENRIHDAKKRAELFSSSLNEARKKENQTMKALEEDRMKWATAYTTKTVELEQVERELEHTVDSIHRSTGNDENIQENQGDTSHEHPKSSHINGMDSFQLYQNTFIENKKLNYDISGKRSEYDIMTKQMEVCHNKIENLTKENYYLAESLRDAEVQLDMRLHQVIQLDEEKEELKRREIEWKDKITSLENQCKLNKTELSITSTELKSAISKVTFLERQLTENNQDSLVRLQATKIKELEEVCTKIHHRLESLEKSHHEEINRLDARNDQTSNHLIEEKSRREVLQNQNNQLTHENSRLEAENRNVMIELSSVESRLEELQSMIPILIADRDRRAHYDPSYLDSKNTVTNEEIIQTTSQPTVEESTVMSHSPSGSPVKSTISSPQSTGINSSLNIRDDMERNKTIPWVNTSIQIPSTRNLDSINSSNSYDNHSTESSNQFIDKQLHLRRLQKEHDKTIQLFDSISKKSSSSNSVKKRDSNIPSTTLPLQDQFKRSTSPAFIRRSVKHSSTNTINTMKLKPSKKSTPILSRTSSRMSSPSVTVIRNEKANTTSTGTGMTSIKPRKKSPTMKLEMVRGYKIDNAAIVLTPTSIPKTSSVSKKDKLGRKILKMTIPTVKNTWNELSSSSLNQSTLSNMYDRNRILDVSSSGFRPNLSQSVDHTRSNRSTSTTTPTRMRSISKSLQESTDFILMNKSSVSSSPYQKPQTARKFFRSSPNFDRRK